MDYQLPAPRTNKGHFCYGKAIRANTIFFLGGGVSGREINLYLTTYIIMLMTSASDAQVLQDSLQVFFPDKIVIDFF